MQKCCKLMSCTVFLIEIFTHSNYVSIKCLNGFNISFSCSRPRIKCFILNMIKYKKGNLTL